MSTSLQELERGGLCNLPERECSREENRLFFFCSAGIYTLLYRVEQPALPLWWWWGRLKNRTETETETEQWARPPPPPPPPTKQKRQTIQNPLSLTPTLFRFAQ